MRLWRHHVVPEWRHYAVLGGGIDCIQQSSHARSAIRMFGVSTAMIFTVIVRLIQAGFEDLSGLRADRNERLNVVFAGEFVVGCW